MRLVTIPYHTHSTAYPWTLTGAWITFGVWALAAVIFVVTTVQRREG